MKSNDIFINLSLIIPLLTIQDNQMSKLWVFYEGLKFKASFKIANSEGGKNGEVVMVLIALKQIFLMENLILDHDGHNIRENSIPMIFGVFFFSFQSLGVLKLVFKGNFNFPLSKDWKRLFKLMYDYNKLIFSICDVGELSIFRFDTLLYLNFTQNVHL